MTQSSPLFLLWGACGFLLTGMGKTAVFVLATLQQLEPVDGEVGVIVMCHTRELAFQIKKEYERFSKYMPTLKTEVFFGGVPISQNEKILSENCPVRLDALAFTRHCCTPPLPNGGVLFAPFASL